VRALLDINVCIALLDPNHVFHERAHSWWFVNRKHGWASCPLTENGIVRIMSNPAYSKEARFPVSDLIQHLLKFVSQTNHDFWPDDLSLRDTRIFNPERLHSSARLTDSYLLALAAHRKGRLATFDRAISISAVKNAKPENLINI
jgi:hypothetical protein